MPDRLGGLGGHLSDLDQRDRYFPVPDGCENFSRKLAAAPDVPPKANAGAAAGVQDTSSKSLIY